MFLFLDFKKKLSILDDVSFENFLIRRLYVKGPYNPFVLALMRNKITPEAKKKKFILFAGLQLGFTQRENKKKLEKA